MMVAFIGLLSGTSPGTCFIKATAAFLVFAGFGLILRYALIEAHANGAPSVLNTAYVFGLLFVVVNTINFEALIRRFNQRWVSVTAAIILITVAGLISHEVIIPIRIACTHENAVRACLEFAQAEELLRP